MLEKLFDKWIRYCRRYVQSSAGWFMVWFKGSRKVWWNRLDDDKVATGYHETDTDLYQVTMVLSNMFFFFGVTWGCACAFSPFMRWLMYAFMIIDILAYLTAALDSVMYIDTLTTQAPPYYDDILRAKPIRIIAMILIILALPIVISLLVTTLIIGRFISDEEGNSICVIDAIVALVGIGFITWGVIAISATPFFIGLYIACSSIIIPMCVLNAAAICDDGDDLQA